jgi:mRNA interferase RelE/StbE
MPRKNLVSVSIERQVLKTLKTLPVKHQAKIIEALEGLKENPLAGEKLSGEHHFLRRIRVGIYRVIYTFKSEELVVLVLDIGHRKDIYRGY